MSVTLGYIDGVTANLTAVKTIDVVGPGEVWLTTHGNRTQIHRKVEWLEVEPFTFAKVGDKETTI